MARVTCMLINYIHFHLYAVLALGELRPSAVNVKNHNHTALHIHHHTITGECWIFWTAVEVQENSEFNHSIPAGHRSPQLFENKARQPPPQIYRCAAHTSSYKITCGESCISTCLLQKHEPQNYTHREEVPETIPTLLFMEKCLAWIFLEKL